MMRKGRTVIRCLCFFALALAILCRLNTIFLRKTLDDICNYTTKVNGYLNEPKNTIDVLTIGSSNAYCSFNPTVLWGEFGINSYMLATQQQPVAASYHYLVEALKTQTPKAVIFETFMMAGFPWGIDDAIIFDAIDPLPMSRNKLEMIAALTKDKESKLPYYIELLRYKERWKELTLADFTFDRKSLHDPYRGQAYFTHAMPVQINLPQRPFEPVQLGEDELAYLQKMQKLCEENGIRLILYFAPFPMGETDCRINEAVKRYAKAHNLDFIDGYVLMKELDFDPNADFADEIHVNVSGSEKTTRYIGRMLQDVLSAQEQREGV